MQPLDPAYRPWRRRVFLATWLSYFGFYFCRKPFFIVKGSLEREFGWDAEKLALIGTAYLLAYAGGQFLSGAIGNRKGPRVLLICGMLITLGCNIALGFSNHFATFLGFMVLNGLSQATGWAGNVGAMAPWFRRAERGTVMAAWATNFQAGGVAANALAAFALGQFGFRYSFFAGSLVLLLIWGFFVFAQRDRPEDVGLPPLEDQNVESTVDAAGRSDWTPDVVKNVILLGSFYFFSKFIRYALWSWAPYLLQNQYNLAGDAAGFASTTFDLAGIAGVLALGIISDRCFHGRRIGLSCGFVLVMTAACVALYVFGRSNLVFFTVSIGLIGFTLYGPDAILASAGAIDVGTNRTATLAAGIINGMGSLGSVTQELVFGRVLSKTGESALETTFAVLVLAAALAATCLSVLVIRSRRGRANL